MKLGSSWIFKLVFRYHFLLLWAIIFDVRSTQLILIYKNFNWLVSFQTLYFFRFDTKLINWNYYKYLTFKNSQLTSKWAVSQNLWEDYYSSRFWFHLHTFISVNQKPLPLHSQLIGTNCPNVLQNIYLEFYLTWKM